MAVCGPTGAGKTRLLEPAAAVVRPAEERQIGGLDARDMTLAELRRAVAIVTQKPVLFSAPLRDNLVAARPDAPWSEVPAAGVAAGVSAFVD